MKLHKWKNNPILKPTGKGDWEKIAVLNPSAWYENGKVYLLYRASGEMDDWKIYLGLAESKDGFHFERVSDKPVFSPAEKGFDAGCIEDPRIVKFGDTFYITYAARAIPPNTFWNGKAKPDPSLKARTWSENLTRSGLAKSKDLRSFERLGPITGDDVDDRDAVIFPEMINGKYVMIHRPAEWIGEKYGCEKSSIWMNFSDDLIHWENEFLLCQPQFNWEYKKIGGSCPPIKTEEGWLTLYHGVDKKHVYRVGVMLLDLNNPKRIIARAPDFILEPEYKFEKKGYVNNVVFPCGNVVINDELFVYYGGADTVCCVATKKMKDILKFVLKYRE